MPAPLRSARLPGPDHLRALAIGWVWLYHYGHLFPHPAWAYDWGAFGWTGVDLFFVLSGYLIAGSLLAEQKARGTLSLRRYYGRRFWRILPPYLLLVAIYELLPSLRERGAPAPLWKLLTFTQNIGLDLSRQGSFSHAWSLCIEEQFYALFPLLLLLLAGRRRPSRYLWIALVLSGLLLRYVTYRYYLAPLANDDRFALEWLQWIYYPTWTRLDGLLAGVAVAALRVHHPGFFEALLRRSYALLGAGLALLGAAWFLCREQWSFEASVYGYPLVALGYALLLIALLKPGGLFDRSNVLTARIARYSYAWYLVHKLVIHATQQALSAYLNPEGNALMACCLASSLFAAFLLNRLVEGPALRLREKIFPKPHPA